MTDESVALEMDTNPYAECVACGKDLPCERFALLQVSCDGVEIGVCDTCRAKRAREVARCKRASHAVKRRRDEVSHSREVEAAYALEVEEKTRHAFARMREHREELGR